MLTTSLLSSIAEHLMSAGEVEVEGKRLASSRERAAPMSGWDYPLVPIVMPSQFLPSHNSFRAARTVLARAVRKSS